MSEEAKKFLPIGTVVMLKNGTKRVMVTGFCAVQESDKERVWDYSGCIYPEGFLSSNKTLLFNHDQIEKICFMGFADDDEERAFKARLNRMIEVRLKQKEESQN